MATVLQFFEGFIDHTVSLTTSHQSQFLSLTVPSQKIYVVMTASHSGGAVFVPLIHNQHYFQTQLDSYGGSPSGYYNANPSNTNFRANFFMSDDLFNNLTSSGGGGYNLFNAMTGTMFFEGDQLKTFIDLSVTRNVTFRFAVFSTKNL